ncbi:MAG TPA: tetratricopeptide repeat protein [Anaerolineales bacterium]|nr:tetratricopeptide repeat protein [Anaerolineales bacterium]
MAEGEFALVQKYLETALDRTASWVGEHDLYAMLADAAVGQRDPAALQKYAPLAGEFASRYDHKLYQAIAQRAQGVARLLAGEYSGAESMLHQALDSFRSLHTHYQVGRTLFELGELAAGQSHISIAREHFSQALKAFEAMGARPDAARTREKIAML